MLGSNDPLLRAACTNRRTITDFDYRVLAFIVPRLSAAEPRPLKLEEVATPFGVDRSNIGRAFKRLIAAGFLIRVDRADHSGTWRYRLPRSPES